MDSSKESSDKNQSQETLRDTLTGLRHLLELLEMTQERMTIECRSITIQVDVVKQLIGELEQSRAVNATPVEVIKYVVPHGWIPGPGNYDEEAIRYGFKKGCVPEGTPIQDSNYQTDNL